MTLEEFDMEKLYEIYGKRMPDKINIGQMNKFISPLIEDIKQKYLNNYYNESNMPNKESDLEKFTHSTLALLKGAFDTAGKYDFSRDISDYINQGKISKSDRIVLNKIYEYSAFANYSYMVYSDFVMKDNIQKECKNLYDRLNINAKELLENHIGKDFFK